MTVIAHVVLHGVSRSQYDALRAAVGWLDHAPTGGLSHLTWWEGDDCHSIDAWDSEESFAAFGEVRLRPAMVELGLAAVPEVTLQEAHEVFLPQKLVVAPTAGKVAHVDNVEVVRSCYEAFARNDRAGVLTRLDATVLWSTPDTVRFGGIYSGIAGVMQFFDKLPDNYAELHVEAITFLDHGDSVVAVGRHRGRSQSGNEFEIPFVHLWSLSGGYVTSFTEFFDTVKMVLALGVPAQVIDLTGAKKPAAT
jgi:ketosteroid isomerase-like protein